MAYSSDSCLVGSVDYYRQPHPVHARCSRHAGQQRVKLHCALSQHTQDSPACMPSLACRGWVTLLACFAC
jgi:hypothetical protein